MAKHKYDGMYVKVSGDPTFWAVDRGKRVKLERAYEVSNYGQRAVVEISPDERDSIPIKGERKPSIEVTSVVAVETDPNEEKGG